MEQIANEANSIAQQWTRATLRDRRGCVILPEQCERGMSGMVHRADGTGAPDYCALSDECPYEARRSQAGWLRIMQAIGLPTECAEAAWDRVPEAFAPALKAYCQTLRTRMKQGEGLILGGGVGVGKTSCLALVCQAAIAQGVSLEEIVYCRSYSLHEVLVGDRVLAGAYYRCGLLLIDDWGTEAPHWKGPAAFSDLIDSRWGNRRPMVFTTNLSPEQLVEKPELARAVDRLRQRSPVLWSKVESQRTEADYREWETQAKESGI